MNNKVKRTFLFLWSLNNLILLLSIPATLFFDPLPFGIIILIVFCLTVFIAGTFIINKKSGKVSRGLFIKPIDKNKEPLNYRFSMILIFFAATLICLLLILFLILLVFNWLN